MIRYALRCAEGHDFESWFRSADDFDRLAEAGQLACATCGGTSVTKALMAPAVPAERPLAPEPGIEALRRMIEEKSDYVGDRFAAEARAIHEGESPRRAVHGEAKADEVRALLDDGIPVAPLPFAPRRRLN